ncbi:hypothetical protein FJTKL_10000 [Diaporthe vaccinii]|uniref:Mpv17/PMP22 family protein n=1 Tax=Diaporthe vaccinii TaxID=105482 RepID=A0ABR4ELT9_9PEZI
MAPSPMFVATTQAVSLSAASNVAAQVIEIYQAKHEGPRALDFLQLGRFVLLSVMTAPPNYQWQIVLEKWFPAYARTSPASDTPKDGRDVEKGVAGQAENASGKPKLNMRNTLIKWFIDCMTVGALLNTVAFLVLMGLMKGQETGMIEQNLRTETIPIIVASYKIWPVASIRLADWARLACKDVPLPLFLSLTLERRPSRKFAIRYQHPIGQRNLDNPDQTAIMADAEYVRLPPTTDNDATPNEPAHGQGCGKNSDGVMADLARDAGPRGRR